MSNKSALLLPLTLIFVGTGWLLSVLQLLPPIDWVWSGALALACLAVLLRGFNKLTLVIGGTFAVATILSIMRQLGSVSFEVELPILLISVGILLAAALHRSVPHSPWMMNSAIDPTDRS